MEEKCLYLLRGRNDNDSKEILNPDNLIPEEVDGIPIVEFEGEKYTIGSLETENFLRHAIRPRQSKVLLLPIGQDDLGVIIYNDKYITYEQLFYDYTYLDGSPCGKRLTINGIPEEEYYKTFLVK